MSSTRLLLVVSCAATLFGAHPANASYSVVLDGSTLRITGNNASDKLKLRLDAATSTLVEVDFKANGTADLTFPAASVAAISVAAGGGNDLVLIDGSLSGKSIVVDGGPGRDTIQSGAGSQTIFGGDGDDLVDAGPGNDFVYLGAGDDSFVWNPGDASDLVEGEDGDDTVEVDGANVAESFDIAAIAGRISFFRNVASVTLDVHGVEQLDVNCLGGADNVTVRNLTGTDVARVNVDLAGPDGKTGDGQADTVYFHGTNPAQTVSIGASKGSLEIEGLPAAIRIAHAEPDLDVATHATVASEARVNMLGTNKADAVAIGPSPVAGRVRVAFDRFPLPVDILGSALLAVFGLSGNDTITTTAPIMTFSVSLELDGGSGNDAITGGDGADLIFGGSGNDSLVGGAGNDRMEGGSGNDDMKGGLGADILIAGNGNDRGEGGDGDDTLLLGSGSDTAVWSPGDDNDTIEGQDGTDRLEFHGANISEHFEISPNGGRIRLTRDVANVTADLNDVEKIDLAVLGGTDSIVMNDVTGTDLRDVTAELEGSVTPGTGDGQLDSVIVNGSAEPDQIKVSAGSHGVSVTRKGGNLRIEHPDVTDKLTVNGLAGSDKIQVGSNVASKLAVAINPD